MAASEQPVEQPDLKYLDFFEVAVNKATRYIASVYEFAKDSSGPLRPGVENVDSTVKAVIGPLYQKFEKKPHKMLLFVDKKVDEAVGALENVVPETIKERSYQVCGVMQQVPEAVKAVLSDVQARGVVETAKSYYTVYEPVAEEWTYAAWKKLLMLPYAPQAVRLAAPPTLFCAEKFNDVMKSLKGMQVPVLECIPLVPVDKLEKAVKVDAC